MAINKVVYGNDTLMDLTNDTVEASNLLEGETAHDRSGTPVTGTAKQGHTIWNKIKSALTQRSKLWFKDAKVSDNSSESATVVEVLQSISENDFDSLPTDGTADGFYEIDGESGGSTGGHTIKDGSGTAMPTQPNLQFADAKVTNDAQGQATKVQNFVDIDWDDWQEVDDNDNTYYRVTDAPLVDGNVEVDLMKKLWENPAPTASFSAQNITLSSADYDFLLLISKRTISTNDTYSDIFCKTYSGCVCHTAPSSSGDMFYRLYTYVDDTHYSISDCTYQLMKTAAQQTWNNGVVPVAIYGIKQKVSISLSAIISSVKATVDYSTDEHPIGTWIDGSTLYECTISTGALPSSTSPKLVAHNISNIDKIVMAEGIAINNGTTLPLPYIYPAGAITDAVHFYADRTYIRVLAGKNQSAWTESYVTIRYTKTS